MSLLPQRGIEQLQAEVACSVATHGGTGQTVPLPDMRKGIRAQRQDEPAHSQRSHQREALCLQVSNIPIILI